MKLRAPRDPFLQQLQLAAAFCPTRSPRPIFQDVLVHADEGVVTLTATDGEVSIRTCCRTEGISGQGSAAFPAATLVSAVRALPTEVVEITEQKVFHEVSGGSALFNLRCDDADQFPSIQGLEQPGTTVEVPAGVFLDLCSRTMFAAAKDMGRYAFHGVLLELDPKEITLVATDGRRLSMARLELPTGLQSRRSSIVPVRGLAQLQRAVLNREGPLSITARDDQVRFSVEDTDIVVQIVEGEFPDFRAVLPKKQDTPREVELDRQEFASAIQRAAVTAGDEARAVELRFDKGTLAVLSRQEGVGEARSEMGIAYEGDAVGIRFNPEFLGEYLKTLPEGAVKFRFKDRASAGLFCSSDDALYVVMPITS